jgi:putative membrane protein
MEISMKTVLTTAVIAIAMSAGAALAQDKADKPTQKFLTEAIQGNFAEVKMGELAQQNGQSNGIKSYGQELATDHGSANQKAMDVAKSVGMSPPSGPNAKQQADYDKMAKLKGSAFDRQFARHMVADHKKDIGDYQKAARMKNAAGQYASNTLPTLQKHLKDAQSLENGGSASR